MKDVFEAVIGGIIWVLMIITIPLRFVFLIVGNFLVSASFMKRN